MSDTHDYPDKRRRNLTLMAMCFSLFMVMLDATVVNVALPTIQKDLDTTLSALEWTMNAYTLMLGVLLVTAGRLGDIFGRRKMFLFGVVIFGFSSAMVGLSTTDDWLIGFRALEGIGAAFMMPATLSIITNTFPPADRGKAIGTWAGVSALGLAIGPLVGGVLVEYVSWQSIFFINVPIAVIALIFTLYSTRESRDETITKQIDYFGNALMMLSLGALVLALVQGNTWGWGSTAVVALLVGSVVGLILFVIVERKVAAPLIDVAMFKVKSFVGANLVASMLSFGMMAFFFFMALYMQNVLGYSALDAGIYFLPATILIMVISPIAGRLVEKVGSRVLIISGLVVSAASLFWLSTIEVNTSYSPTVLIGYIAMGIGVGLVMSPMSTTAMNSVNVDKAGVASGVLSSFRMIGGTLGVAVMGAIVQGVGQNKLVDELDAIKPPLPASQQQQILDAFGSGSPPPAGSATNPMTQQIDNLIDTAFVQALSAGLIVCALVSVIGAVIAVVLIRGKAASAGVVGDGDTPRVAMG